MPILTLSPTLLPRTLPVRNYFYDYFLFVYLLAGLHKYYHLNLPEKSEDGSWSHLDTIKV